MDFKRIEAIFLCAFLTLNIFLMMTFKQGNGHELNTSNSIAPIETRLKQDKITTAKKIKMSSKKTTGYYLSSETSEFKVGNSKSYIQSGQSGPGKIQVTDTPQKNIRLFLKNNEIIEHSTDYKYFISGALNDSKLMMAQGFEGLPFFDESAQLILEVVDSDGAFHSFGKFNQTHIKNVEALREKQATISEKDAIETLYTANKIPVEGKITNSLLAYTKIFTVRGKNVYIPAWFIWIEDSKGNRQIEKVNAFSNSVFSANVSDVKEVEL